MPSPNSFRIAHCSDPHWGRQFNRDIWNDFVAKTVAYRPNLILITGDCVDTPWRLRFQAAKRDIDELDLKVNEGRAPDDRCHIRMTPGNHDVRILGLIPVQPSITIPVVMALAGLILGLAWHVGFLSPVWSGGLFGIALFVCLAIGQCCIGQFSSIFHDRMGCASAPEQFTANHITVDLYSLTQRVSVSGGPVG